MRGHQAVLGWRQRGAAAAPAAGRGLGSRRPGWRRAIAQLAGGAGGGRHESINWCSPGQSSAGPLWWGRPPLQLAGACRPIGLLGPMRGSPQRAPRAQQRHHPHNRPPLTAYFHSPPTYARTHHTTFNRRTPAGAALVSRMRGRRRRRRPPRPYYTTPAHIIASSAASCSAASCAAARSRDCPPALMLQPPPSVAGAVPGATPPG